MSYKKCCMLRDSNVSNMDVFSKICCFEGLRTFPKISEPLKNRLWVDFWILRCTLQTFAVCVYDIHLAPTPYASLTVWRSVP